MERATSMLREFILDEMRKREMSGRQFAKLVDVSSATIVNALNEREPTTPSMEFLIKLADSTGTDLATIFALAFPEVAERTRLSPDATLTAQRIEKLPDHIKDAVNALIRGSR